MTKTIGTALLLCVVASCTTGPSYPMDVTFRRIAFDGQTPSDEVVSATTEQQTITIEGTLYVMSTCGSPGGTLEDANPNLTVRLHPTRTSNQYCTHEPGSSGSPRNRYPLPQLPQWSGHEVRL